VPNGYLCEEYTGFMVSKGCHGSNQKCSAHDHIHIHHCCWIPAVGAWTTTAGLLPQNPTHRAPSRLSRLDHPNPLLQPALPRRARPKHGAHTPSLSRARIQTRRQAPDAAIPQPQPAVSPRIIRAALHPKQLSRRARHTGSIIPVSSPRTRRVCDRRQRSSRPKQRQQPSQSASTGNLPIHN
jgi:hypothetical protein